jgi:signal transduction histidine kinase/CheY-like chemotaxis protein
MKPFELQFRIVQPNCGKIVWLHQRVVPIAGPDGKLIRQDCVMYDITDRKRAELSLVDNEARLQKQNLALAALARSKTLHGDDLQAALREITKVAAETLDIERAGVWLFNDQHTGIECMDLYIRSENTHTQGAVIAARDYPRYFERLQEQRTIAADDASNDPGISELRESYLEPLGIASMVDAPIRIGERLIGVLCHEHTGPQRHWTQEELNFCGSIADLAALAVESSEHNQLQMKLQQSQKLQSIGTLAGGIAHDFNNLLAVILGNATLHMRDRSLPERARNALKEIVDAAERGSSLTSQLLAYARGGLHQPVPTDINKPIISVSEMLRRTVTGQTPIVLQLASDIPVTMADASQIEQVIMNLLMNAVQASDASGTVTIITDAVELNPEQARRMNMGAGGYVRIRVCDQGCGMNEQTQSRIFEPFFTTRATGRGMGLAATLGIIESHRGNIRVDSKPGEGTTMSVWLPATGEKPAAHAVPAERAEPFQPPTGDETILVIDDDSAVSRAVERLLASLGYVVVTHANVVEALAFLDLHSADINLVLADVHVSGAPEEEFFAQLCNRVGHAAFLLADVEDELAVLNLAGDRHRVAFIRKPYTLSTLSHQVRDLLDQVKTP